MVVEKACAPEFALHFEALYKFLVITIIIISLVKSISLLEVVVECCTRFNFTEYINKLKQCLHQ